MVDGGDVVDTEYLFWCDMTEHGDFFFGSGAERFGNEETASNLWVRTNQNQLARPLVEELTRSGRRPKPRKEFMVVWVGFVFCSPCMSGTSET